MPVPSECALASRVDHSRNVTLRQDAILPPLGTWLAAKFGRRYRSATINELAAAAALPAAPAAGREEAKAKIATCHNKLTQYRGPGRRG